jgi:pimeloyl-ACP methyl ester carboxylesterase
MAFTSVKVSFAGSLSVSLDARLEMPEAEPRAYAIFAHCFTCSKDVFAAFRISRGLTDYGIAVLRFDFTGLGASEGDFANTGFSSNVADLVAAAEFLGREYESPRLLVGHSLGGAAVIVAASRLPEVAAVATLNAPSEPSHLLSKLGPAAATAESQGEAEVVIGGRAFRISREFVKDLAKPRMEKAARELRRPLLVLHAPADRVVAVEQGHALFATASHPKSFVALDGADHLLTRRSDSEYVARLLNVWVERYLVQA